MSFNTVIEKYRKIAFSERDKGERFERLMQAYLQTDPLFANNFKKVWLWEEFPGKLDLGGSDTGIDLVARTYDGDYWAVQCKFFKEGTTIDKPAVDTFLSTSGRQFKNEELQTTRFAHRLWIDTTGRPWGSNAEQAIRNQDPQVQRIGLYQLREAPVDWDKLDSGISGEKSRTEKKRLRPHQVKAVEKTHEHFSTQDRGKLIMACGTGKTFTALRVAEKETDGKGLILFLVPSISLLGQTLREWSADALEPINAICICSDPEVSKKRGKEEDSDLMSVIDLALPASTNVQEILAQFRHINDNGKGGMTVVFSTYQSIEVISRAQKELKKTKAGHDIFDLIICDEAHRTTGVTLSGEDESAFTKVHDNNFISSRKRLYMTATPRLYDDSTKSKAAQAEAILCSMDDDNLYGNEIYRIGFGEAVEQGLLTDYKVLVLTLNDKDVPPAVQKMIADDKQEINADDASKLIGCVNALSKQILGDNGIIAETDPAPMRRAVAFCQKITASKKIADIFNTATDAYISSLPADKKEKMVSVGAAHVDGTMSAPERDRLLGWLKEETSDGECRILTNVRCLSEGVDVPSLDAVMFLSARNSQVDVVQSVGRVMRLAPGKKYGYIIIPVVVPSDVDAERALDDNERYKVVWTVLNALRAHDDRFNATVNKIELNRKKPDNILVGRPDFSFDDNGNPIPSEPDAAYGKDKSLSEQLALQFEQLQSVVFARMVQKVGDRRYWEQWAKEVAQIATNYIERINRIRKSGIKYQVVFADFMKGLHKNINPSITEGEAVEMLAQHIITKPVFEALFEGYSFVANNPISLAMQAMIDVLETEAIDKDTETLQKFYDSVRKRAADIDNAEGKQRIIIELYDKFFKTAFPRMVEKLGIVYTPVEVVDFIIHSVHDVLQKEFGRGIGDENVHILDPFTGTGTFITRLLQSGLISKEQLPHKYHHEIFANEIVLLAYYIAAVNIENAYHDAMQIEDYESFDGICLTDTFQLGETDDTGKLQFKDMFPKNSARVERQKKAPLRVIIGNPPYSVGQKSANDNAQNQSYPFLENRIEQTYIANVNVTQKKSLYDSYFKAFRWSTDRLDSAKGGIVAFITNGNWLNSASGAGFRKSLEQEFSSIYVINLRGNQNTSGELSKKEGGKIFGSGSRIPTAITILVKKTDHSNNAKVYYHDIGDYLSREDKLNLLKKYNNTRNIKWTIIEQNDHSDWLTERNEIFTTYISLEPEKKYDLKTSSFFTTYSLGLSSNRAAWVYNFSRTNCLQNMQKTIDFYNLQRIEYHKLKNIKEANAKDVVSNDSTKISWTVGLLRLLSNNKNEILKTDKIAISLYRPFQKQFLYFDRDFNEQPGQQNRFFPSQNHKNIVITIPGIGSVKDFYTLITDCVRDLDTYGGTQCFPLYYYEEPKAQNHSLFDNGGQDEYIRRDGVSDFILERARKQYGNTVKKEDIFYYVYGFLHSPEYRETFANDLKKMLPRLPLVDDVKDFWAFSKAGRKLAELHINYEEVPPYEGVTVNGDDGKSYKVEKMRFPKKGRKDSIIYNSKITIENIPAEAYEYVVNGKSAIEWIMERYQVTTHKDSGITNNPNDWADEVGNPRYILDLLLSIINVSVQTVGIIKGLPKVKFE